MITMDWIEKRAALAPEKIALIHAEQGKSFSYEELNNRASGLANYLFQHGVREGDRIALICHNHIAYFDLFFACWKLGAIFVPINEKLSEAELLSILNDCQPMLVITNRCIVHSQFSYSFLLLDEKYEQLLRAKDDSFEAVCDNHACAIIYTGGTTGKPKGVVLTKKNILANALNTVISWGLTSEDITYTAIPMFHTGGLNSLTIPILLNGGTVVYSERFHPEQAVRHLHDYQCTIVLFIPTMYQMMINTEIFHHYRFPKMKCFLSGGAPCPLAIYEAFQKRGEPFKEGYGLSEAGPNNFFITPDRSLLKKGSVGKAMMLNSVKIVMDQREVEDGEVGELYVSGDHVFSHYWNNPQETMQVLTGGWLKTGDLARRDEEGNYYIVGRVKDMIISGGENVYPVEVENTLLQHEDIDEAAVIGIKDALWGEMVCAYIASKSKQVTSVELKTHCEKYLTHFKIPKKFIFLDTLPKTVVGKIDKKALLKEESSY